MNSLAKLEQQLFRLGAVFVVLATLFMALPSVTIPNGSAKPILALMALGMLWVVGRVAWARPERRPEPRPKPRRRGLPPPPHLEEDDRGFAENR